MYIYFQDWSTPLFLTQLKNKNIPHDGYIIKALATTIHPSKMFQRPNILAIKTPCNPLPSHLEKYLTELGVTSDIRNRVRALFLFANRSDIPLYERAFPHITHPLEIIHGLDRVKTHPELYAKNLHLDIFVPQSLHDLFVLLNFTPNGPIRKGDPIVSYQEVHDYFRTLANKR